MLRLLLITLQLKSTLNYIKKFPNTTISIRCKNQGIIFIILNIYTLSHTNKRMNKNIYFFNKIN